MQPIYNVPIIPQNLRREETVLQIVEALNYLSDVTKDIFEKVNNKINENNKRISAIDERINISNKQINRLAEIGANKATQMFSNSKYPAAHVNKPYTSIFHNEKQLLLKKFNIHYENSSFKSDTPGKLQFYHVKLPESKKETIEGLGHVSKNIDSVNDLLLYNTGQRPYSKYTFSESVQIPSHTKKEEVQETSEIGDAPSSISDHPTLVYSATKAYFYSPDLGDVPTIDLPLDLPDLPGIADDLRYVNELGPGIAPSVSHSIIIPDLPLPPIVAETNIKKESVTASVPNITSEPMQPKEEIKELPEMKQEPEMSIESQPIVETFEEKPLEKSSSSIPPVEGNAHANLMEAIRNAGGLKNAKLRSAEVKKPEKSQVCVTNYCKFHFIYFILQSNGDFMADLHAKLSMRRKGISGDKKMQNNQGLDAGSTMSRLSSIIPPPLPSSSENPESTTDDDWED